MSKAPTKNKYLLSPLTIIFIGLFVWYFIGHRDSFKPLLNIGVLTVVLVMFLQFANHMINGVFMKLTVEVFTKKMSLVESVYVAILSAIGNFFGPLLGGTTIRAVYLKKTHNLPYSFFTSTLAAYYLILFAISNVLAIISLLLLGTSPQRSGLLVFFSVWLAVLIALMFARLPDRSKLKALDKHKVMNFLWSAIYEIETGWRRLLKTRGMLFKLCLLALVVFTVSYLMALFEFKAIHAPISLAALGLYTAISNSSMLISLTPGAIGIRESLLLVTSSTIGVSNAQILQVSVIDRAASFLLLFILYLATKALKRHLKSVRIS